MVHATTYSTSTQVLWASKTIETNSRTLPPDRGPLSGDPEYNALVNDYVSRSPTTAFPNLIDGTLTIPINIFGTIGGPSLLQMTDFFQRFNLVAVSADGTLNMGGRETLISGSEPADGATLAFDPQLVFVDNNANGVWNPGEPVIYDVDFSGTFDSATDTVISGTTPAQGALLVTDAQLLFFDTDSSTLWEAGEPVVYDRNADGIYQRGIPVKTNSVAAVDSNLLLKDSGGTARIAITTTGSTASTLTATGTTTSQSFILNVTRPSGTVNSGTFNDILLNPSTSVIFGTGAVTWNGIRVGPSFDVGTSGTKTIRGFSFFPQLIKPSAGTVVIDQKIVEVLDQYIFGSAGASYSSNIGVGISINNSAFGSPPTITTMKGLEISLGSGVIPTTAIGLDITGVATGTTRIGIRQTGVSPVSNRLAAPTRIGNTAAPNTNWELDIAGDLYASGALGVGVLPADVIGYQASIVESGSLVLDALNNYTLIQGTFSATSAPASVDTVTGLLLAGGIDPNGRAFTTGIRGLGFFTNVTTGGTGASLPIITSSEIGGLIQGIAGGSFTVNSYTGQKLSPSLASGVTITIARGFHYAPAAQTATITSHIGLDIESITAGTTRIGIRQLGSTETNRLAGSTRIGDTGTAPTDVLEVVGYSMATLGFGNIRSGSADPTTTDITSGHFMLWKNTTSAELRLWANDGGTMKSVSLA